VKAEWGEAKGFYWAPLLREVVTYLRDDEERDEEVIGAALCGLIKYKLKKLKDFQNISDDDDKFARNLSGKGVPNSICDLLFENYVVEATVLEAIGKPAFLKEDKGLIDEEMRVFWTFGFDEISCHHKSSTPEH